MSIPLVALFTAIVSWTEFERKDSSDHGNRQALQDGDSAATGRYRMVLFHLPARIQRAEIRGNATRRVARSKDVRRR